MNRGSDALHAQDSRAHARFNEAPIHESGKCSPGSGLGVGLHRFNEAPIHESGKSSISRGCRSRAGCFNEAPIHESGKSESYAPNDTASCGFNEAPIHESGKCRLAAGSVGGEPASMRPRFMNRGSQTGVVTFTPAQTLQ